MISYYVLSTVAGSVENIKISRVLILPVTILWFNKKCKLLPPRPASNPGWGGAGRTVPSAPRAGRAVGPGGSRLGRHEASARGPRRCRPPTRPVLKHGPRSLTRARVRGSHESRRGAMKVKAALAGGRGGIPRPLPVRRGRTTGPSRPPRRGGGA